MTIRTKVTLLATVSVGLALALTAAAATLFISSQTRTATLTTAQAEVQQADRSLSLFIENQFQVLHSLALDPTLWAGDTQWTSFLKTTADTTVVPNGTGRENGPPRTGLPKSPPPLTTSPNWKPARRPAAM